MEPTIHSQERELAVFCKQENMVIEASSHRLFVSMQSMKRKLMVEQR